MSGVDFEDQLCEGALVLHGLDDAIAGVSDCGRLISSYERVIKIFEDRDRMSPEEAE